MADYRMMGHAMRRRAGAESSHLGAAGKKTSVEVPNVIQQHITASSAKLSVGAVKGTLMPRKNTQAGNPTAGGKGAGRTFVANPGGERLGAAYKVTAKYSVSSPEAGKTMRSARIISPTMGMQDAVHDSME